MLFEYDIFISHVGSGDQDYEPGPDDWAVKFRKLLERRLQEMLGRLPKIWLDTRLTNDGPSSIFTLLMRDTKVMLCIISPAYLRSKRCLEELRQFIKAKSDTGGLYVKTQSRVFPILKSYVPTSRHPEELKGMIGWAFYDWDEYGAKLEWSPDPGGVGHDEYLRQIEDLAWNIATLIKKLGGEEPAGRPEPRAAGEQFTFVCYAREDQSFVRELASELKAKGIRVWVDQLDIRVGENWDKKIDEALYGCNQFLIVLSPTAVDSTEVRGELRTALDENKRIVPVIYQTCRVPRQLRSIQHIDFSSTDLKNAELLQQLLHALSERISL